MSAALIAFAKTGNPGTPALKWPEFDPENPYRMVFGDKIEAVPVDKGVFFYIANPDVNVRIIVDRRDGPQKPDGSQNPGR